jgi:hypothetical protein
MSIRANPRNATPIAASPQTPISFKDEFIHSTAALAASHDETVSHILSRLDQLQDKIQTQPENAANLSAQRSATAATGTQATRTATAVPTDSSVHARLASLENMHQDTLHQVYSKLGAVERQLQVNQESQTLITQIASRLQQVEPKLQSQASLGDRLSRIEASLQSHVGRVNSLESRAASDTSGPDQERILSRINAKLDVLEEQQRNARLSAARTPAVEPRAAASSYREPSSVRRSIDTGSERVAQLDAEMDKQERAKFLQARIEKLKELRNKYESADVQ